MKTASVEVFDSKLTSVVASLKRFGCCVQLNTSVKLWLDHEGVQVITGQLEEDIIEDLVRAISDGLQAAPNAPYTLQTAYDVAQDNEVSFTSGPG